MEVAARGSNECAVLLMKTLGIDLGTTNSVLAVAGEVVSRAAGGPEARLASVVAFLPNGTEVVGAEALQRRAIDPKNTIHSAKRLMGQHWHAHATRTFVEQYPFELRETPDGPAFATRAGAFTPEQIAQRVLAGLLSLGDLQPDLWSAVVSVPAAFSEPAVAATLAATRCLGFAEVRSITEPVAAALPHIVHAEEPLGCTVVYDLGGGTLDVAMLDCTGPEARVLGCGGDAFLGGEDVDAALAAWVGDRVLERFGWDLRSDAVTVDRLRLACERAKVELCLNRPAFIDIAEVDEAAPPQVSGVELEPADLDKVAFGLVQRSFLVCDELLGEMGVTVRDVDTVILAGGGSYMPAIRQGVQAYFGREPRCDFSPKDVVAIGASMFDGS